MPEPADLLVFDLDGTLVDSRRDIAGALNHARAAFGYPPLEVDLVTAYIGDGARALVQRGFATTDPNVVEAALGLFSSFYAAHCLDHTELYPDVRETLEGSLAGRTCAVVTNKPESFSQRILHGLGLAGRFAVVLGGDSGVTRKPDPAGILEVLRRTGIPPSRSVVLGDSVHDLAAARGAGTRVGLVTYGYGRETDLRAARPDFVLRRFADIAAILTGENPNR